MAKLALDHQQRYTLARHLQGVRVAQLVRREASSHAGSSCRSVELSSHTRRRRWPPAGQTAQHAEERADWQAARSSSHGAS